MGSKDTSWEELAWESPCSGIYFIIHQIFSEFLQPLRDFRISRVSPFLQRVCPFFLWFFFIYFFGILLAWSTSGLPDLSSTLVDTVTGEMSLSVRSSRSRAYCWWWRRAWRRCWAMTLLSWKCPWSWWIRPWRRIWWQTWNHNRNEVLRVALSPNPVLNEMRFLTIDPFTRISVFIAMLSERQYCWRVFEDFHSQEYVIVGLPSISASLPFCWSGASTRRNRQQILFPQVQELMQGGTCFPKVRRMLLFSCSFSSWHTLGQPPRHFAGTLFLPLCLLLRPILKFLERWGCAHEVHLGKYIRGRILVSNFSVTCNSFREFQNVGLVSACLNSSWDRLRRLHVVKDTTPIVVRSSDRRPTSPCFNSWQVSRLTSGLPQSFVTFVTVDNRLHTLSCRSFFFKATKATAL